MQLLSVLLAAAAALSCLATAANGDVAQDLLVPFNDLLPPLLGAASESTDAKVTTKTIAATTTTTRKPITVAHATLFKPTKKSYYQQQTQHIKELHLIDEDAVVPHDYKEQEQHLQHLHATQQQQQQRQQQQQQKQQQQQQQRQQLQQQQLLQQKLQQKVQEQRAQQYQLEKKLQKQQKFQQPSVPQTATKLQLQKATNSQQQFAAFSIPQQQVAPKAPQQHVYKHVSVRPQSQHRFQQPQAYRQDNLQQYIDFYQHTTHRPPKAGLPTLTPFPRHLK